ncbi:helix-turn-helix domain-containing protein [Actinocrispum wychmicini]|nr:helix-turn-helix domain-containing protein [Actinocrispum wychmicini]
MEMRDLQARIAENIKVLLAITGIRTQAALARGLGWEAAKITRLLQGKQEWTLSDIVTVGEAFRLDDPFLLTRPVTEVVGAIAPVATVNRQVTEADTRQ